MAKFDVEVAPGATYEVDAPDETTAWKWAKAEHEKAVAKPTATTAEAISANPLMRFAIGAARPILGGLQLGANATGIGADWINDKLATLKQMQQRGMAARAADGPSLAEKASPFGFATHLADKAGVDLPGALGEIASPVSLKLMRALPAAATLPGRVGVGIGAGTITGALQPVESGGENFGGEKTGQIVAGGVVGGGLPLVTTGLGKVLDIGRKAVEPLTAGGREAIKRRFFEAEIPDPLMRAKIADAVEAVPGNTGAPTTVGDRIAEAARLDPGAATGRAGARLVAMEDVLSSTRGGADTAKTIQAMQEAERRAAIDRISRGPIEQDAAQRARAANASVLYPQAEQVTPPITPELVQIWNDPMMRGLHKEIQTLAESKGVQPNDSTRYIDLWKKSIDGALNRSQAHPGAFNAAERARMLELRQQLMNWINDRNPAYEAARGQFAADSAPINQMAVGQVLKDALTGATGQERAATFATAMRNAPQTIRRATGEARFTNLGEVLTPEQLAQAQQVQALLERDATRTSLAKGVQGQDALFAFEQGRGPQGPAIPALFNRPATVTNWLMRRMGHGADQIIANELARDMLQNPAQFAGRYLRPGPVDPTAAARAELLRKIQTSAPVVLTTMGE